MPAFLKKLTEHIYSTYGDRLGASCIVLPNRRAILYIKSYLAGMLKQTTFLPEFYSIEDFVARCSGLVISDSLADQFRLYELHCELEGKDARSVEEFFPYAAWMLSDFNEIDMYLVDRQKLYTYLTEVRAMKLWNPDGRPLTDFEKNYLEFYRSIKQYYDGLHEKTNAKKLAYQGQAFRQLAENIEKEAEGWPWDKVIFAGFNALTPAEEKIIKYLLKREKAEIFWDADDYYLNNKDQEAGYFLRKYFHDFDKTEPRWIGNNFMNKKVRIIGVPGNTGQLKYAGEILLQLIKEKGSLDRTALVLSDESLLLPMLNSIPEEAGDFNVTMGLALKHTPLYSMIDTILSLQRNADRFREMRQGKQRAFYSKDLLRLICHPWFNMLLPGGSVNLAMEINEKVRNSNRIFIPANEIKELFHEVEGDKIMELFPGKVSPESMMESLSLLLGTLRQGFIELKENGSHDYGLELEYVFRFNSQFQRMKDLMKSYESISSLRTLQMIFRQLAQQDRIAFRGEPLKGLQVMGMLETRTLDFDTVIMISVNEGTLPSARLPNSFIPFDIKTESDFKLPTYRHNNRVFAYHFYRLLQRADEAYLLYNVESNALGGGEKSRFITQLQHEGPKYSPGIDISEELLSISPPAGIRDTTITIDKDKHVMRLLREEAEKGFHPSSLSKYINCPLQFYLARLARLADTDEIEETIDARTLGIVAHESLQKLLGEYLGVKLTKEIFKGFKKETRAEVRRQFQKFYHEDDISYGKNYLVVNVAEHMLNQLFDREAQWLGDGQEMIVSALEYGLSTLLLGADNTQVKFKGTADRIDKKGEKVRIIDYKTGGVDTSKLKPANWDKLFSDPEYSQAFQLMMYAWLYHKTNPEAKDMDAGIISLKTPGNGPDMVKPPDSKAIDLKTLQLFEEHLITLIQAIFDPSVPFKQTEDDKRCKYCSYKEICNRSLGKDEY
ncbi:MAG: hypothetical protein DRJ15_06760 [Bacteroidetes bacterium]|nr:MAG: hypothetical protein DRJ15_06760 [Bacteroidota bacterium]